MKKRTEQTIQVTAILLTMALLMLTVSCQSLNPFDWMSEQSPHYEEPANAVTGTLADVTDSATSWAWLSILLVFVFPQARQPIVAFISAVFTALALPFTLLIDKYRSK